MPIYEYWCSNCGLWFEALRSMACARDPAPCPRCAQPAPRQVPTSFSAFTMRGGYPRGIPDKGQAYGPIGPYTTYATPEQKAKAAEEERHLNWEYTRKEREEQAYRKKWEEPKPASTPG